MSHWVPILSSSSTLGVLACDAIAAVARDTIDLFDTFDERNQLSGYEAALLFAYLAGTWHTEPWRAHTGSSLTSSATHASELSPALNNGLSGLGWTIHHMSALFDTSPQPALQCLTVGPERDPSSDIATFLLQLLRREQWPGTYDAISGLVGFGVFFLERMPASDSITGIKLVLDHLEIQAHEDDEGITWMTRPEFLPDWQRQISPNGHYNLGVAHGVPGVIHFCSEVVAVGVETKRATRLLEGAVDWLIAHRNPEGSLWWFPSWIDGRNPIGSRLAWCYGDLGILAVMVQAAHRCKRSRWHELNQALLEHCLNLPLQHAGVLDASLCHGAVGVAHIFNRLYQQLGDDRCRDVAIAWIERALSMRRPAAGNAGFAMHSRPDSSKPPLWKFTPTFLGGAIGVALGLLAATTTLEPAWDRMLLLSGRPQACL